MVVEVVMEVVVEVVVMVMMWCGEGALTIECLTLDRSSSLPIGLSIKAEGADTLRFQ